MTMQVLKDLWVIRLSKVADPTRPDISQISGVQSGMTDGHCYIGKITVIGFRASTFVTFGFCYVSL